jgi:hypothetical protein
VLPLPPLLVAYTPTKVPVNPQLTIEPGTYTNGSSGTLLLDSPTRKVKCVSLVVLISIVIESFNHVLGMGVLKEAGTATEDMASKWK